MTPVPTFTPTIGRDGSIMQPANDEQARAAGMQKLTKVSDGSVIYRWPPDAREIAAGGEYTWNRWE